MAFKPFTQINLSANEAVTSKHINAVQNNTAAALQQVLGKDQLDMTLLKNVVLEAGIINKVPHKLGRILSGWIVVRNHGGYAVLTDQQDNNDSPHLLLYLTSPASVTVDLLVF